MVPYLKTGLHSPFPTVPSIETVCNHIQQRLRRQPPVSTVPYLETRGSNCSPFRNCLQPPVATVPYLETGGSNGYLFRNWIATLFSTLPYLETGGSNVSLFRNQIATPLSNGTIFKNRLQPYLETFKKATLHFNGSIFQKTVVLYLETSGSNDSLFRNWIAAHLSNGCIFTNRLQSYLETLRKSTPGSTVPY